MITTAHVHKSGVIFHIFQRAFKLTNIKELPPKPRMTKIASRGRGREGPALTLWRPVEQSDIKGLKVHCHAIQ